MKNIIYIILISLFLVSCDMETVIDLEIPEQDNMLVLNGLLYLNECFLVYIFPEINNLHKFKIRHKFL